MMKSLVRLAAAALVTAVAYAAVGLALSSQPARNLPFAGYLIAYYLQNPVCDSRHQAGAGLEESDALDRWIEKESNQITLVRRDDGGFQLWKSRIGEWWFPPSTREEFVRYSFGQYALNPYPGLSIPRRGVVVDGGGFVGDFAKFALASGASRVVIFEPASDALECIRRNLKSELESGQATLIPRGIWDRQGRLFLADTAEGNPAANAILEDHRNSGEWIEVVTVDEAIKTLGISRVDVIKMDIEGAEVRALQGAQTIIQRDHPQLAIATEHTNDHIKNNQDVIRTVGRIEPRYQKRCGFCVTEAASLVPQTLYFNFQ